VYTYAACVLFTVALHGYLSIRQLASIDWVLLRSRLGFLDALAGFTSSCSALSVLAQGFVRVKLGNAFGIFFWIAIGGIRRELK
jgi:hypothetical protein